MGIRWFAGNLARLLVVMAILATCHVAAADEDAGPALYGVHDLKLSADADTAKLDEFLKGKFAETWKEPRDGLTMIVLKGDRGDRKDQYQLVYHYASTKDRDRHFPNNQPSQDFAKAVEPTQAAMTEFWGFFEGSVGYTDYSPIGPRAEKNSEHPTYGIHNIELAEGTDAAEFEKFVKDEFAPAWTEWRDGLRFAILKGIRGARKDKYQLVYVFDSKEARDKHFPGEGSQGTAAFGEAVQPVADVMQKLNGFGFRSTGYSDVTAVK